MYEIFISRTVIDFDYCGHTGQKLDSTQVDSTLLAIISYFKDGSNELSKYIEKEIILDIKDESYFSSFDEFDSFQKY